jgi:hypothetical protein
MVLVWDLLAGRFPVRVMPHDRFHKIPHAVMRIPDGHCKSPYLTVFRAFRNIALFDGIMKRGVHVNCTGTFVWEPHFDFINNIKNTEFFIPSTNTQIQWSVFGHFSEITYSAITEVLMDVSGNRIQLAI